MKDFYLKQTTSNLQKLVEEYEKEIERLKSLQTIPKMQPLAKYNFRTKPLWFRVYKRSGDGKPYEASGRTSFTANQLWSQGYHNLYICENDLSEIIAEDVKIKEANQAVDEENRKAIVWYHNMLKALGIPEKISGPRSRGGVARIPNPAYSALVAPYESIPEWDKFLRLLEEHKKTLHAQEVQASRDKAAEEAKKRELLKVADICHGLGLDISEVGTTMAEALCALRERDAYLDLACAMETCRNDFSRLDGVKAALARIGDDFIKADIQEAVDNFDGDGRVFRDCTHNYEYIYKNLVNYDFRNYMLKYNMRQQNL